MAEDAPEIESQVQTAMRSRVTHFKEQADSLTFEGVRRLLEKDLGMEKYALDVHKRFIKQCLLECIGGADDENASKNSGESEVISKPREETAESEGLQLKKDVKDEKMEDSPVLGLMTGNKTSKHETKETQSNANKVPSESTIKKAVRGRASYVRANSDKVTMAGLRRLLEKDLGLDKCTLDPFKKLISEQLDETLNSTEGSESPAEVEKKKVKKGSDTKVSKKGSSEESNDSSGSESDEIVEEEVKPRKKIIPKGKMQKSEEPKKRKKPVKEANVSSTKRMKPAEKNLEENIAEEESENEDDNSQSSDEKLVKKKEVPTPAYGKRVEHLKSVIKSCGMSVPPVIYKKVKQVPENKREASLIKELEDILAKEGLSANPSEKEIKEVKKKKERARELEGIDMSNIVSSSRRRSTTSFAPPPPKPKIPVESDGSESSDDDNEDDEDDDDDDDEEEGDDDDGNGDSQSEELDGDNDEDSD